jgi:hypothetical protein
MRGSYITFCLSLSRHCVIVAAEGLPPRLDTWVDLHSVTRLCRQVVKVSFNVVKSSGHITSGGPCMKRDDVLFL